MDEGVSGSSGQQQSAKNEYSLQNANEEIVKENVRRIMSMSDMCQCERCFNDACAIVLNKMPPRYATSRKGEMLSQLPQMTIFTRAEISVMAAQALKIVNDSPNH